MSGALGFLLVFTALAAGEPQVLVQRYGATGEGVMGETLCFDAGKAMVQRLQALESYSPTPGRFLAAFSCLPIRDDGAAAELIAVTMGRTAQTSRHRVPASLCRTAMERANEDLATLAREDGRGGGVASGVIPRLSATCVPVPQDAREDQAATVAAEGQPAQPRRLVDLTQPDGTPCTAASGSLAPAGPGRFESSGESGTCPSGVMLRPR